MAKRKPAAGSDELAGENGVVWAFRAAVAPGSAKADKRTVDLIWSAGALVKRYDWERDRYYLEELPLDAARCDMSILASGTAPLLDSHSKWGGVGSQFGVVDAARLEPGKGVATVRFSKRDDVEPVYQDVVDGIINNVSVGYRVEKFEPIPPQKDGDLWVYRATKWTPYEVSFVVVPADAGAQVIRSAEPFPSLAETELSRAGSAHITEVLPVETADEKRVREERERVERETRERAERETRERAEAAATREAAAREDGARLERERIAAIRETGRVAKFTAAEIEAAIADPKTTAEAFRAKAWAELARRSDVGGEVRPHAQAVPGGDEVDRRRTLVENALLHRIGGNALIARVAEGDGAPKTLIPEAREYRGRSLLEIGRMLLEANGVRTSALLDKRELAAAIIGLPVDGVRAGGYQGTTDFASVLANVFNKTLRQAYQLQPRTFMPLGRMAGASDFKTIQRTMFSDAPPFIQVNENGEFKRGSMSDGKETYSLATFGRVVPFTRQAIINDDLGAFERVPAAMAASAAALQSDTVWGLWTANAALSDTVALFHATHGNLDGAGAIAVATLGTLRQKMRVQKSPQGVVLNLTPAYLVVPAALETIANQFTSAQYVSAKSSDINPYAKGAPMSLAVVVEGRLDATSATQWYVSADPSQVDTFEYCYLDGNDAVYLETRVGFDVDGIEIKGRLDFAAKFIDYRGVARNG